MQALVAASLRHRLVSTACRPSPHRSLSAANSLPPPGAAPSEPVSPFVRAFRLAAFGTVLLTAWNVLPVVDSMTVPHALSLTQARDGLLVRSGARRMSGAMRRRPERRADFLALGAVRGLADTIVRDRFAGAGRGAGGGEEDVRRTREALLEPLSQLAELPEARSQILDRPDLVRVIAAEAEEGSPRAKVLCHVLHPADSAAEEPLAA